MKRNILGFLGADPVRSTIHGSIESVPDERRRQLLADAEALGRTAN